MNDKTKMIIASVILLIVITSFVYAKSTMTNAEPTIRDQCESGSIDKCNEYVKQQQSEYKVLETKMKIYNEEAEKARGVIKEQLSGTFM